LPQGPFPFLIDQVQDSLRFYYNLLAVKCHRVWIKFLLRFKLLNCERFYISVAFITDGGMESLIGILDIFFLHLSFLCHGFLPLYQLCLRGLFLLKNHKKRAPLLPSKT
jgi:hypothetical protein